MTRPKKRVKSAPKPLEAPPSKVGRWTDVWIMLGLLAAIAIVYGQCVGHEFLNYDDPEYVTANTHVRAGLTGAGIVWAFTSAHDANWIPLTWISHMLDCTLFGSRSEWPHLENVVLHAANALLLFVLMTRLTKARWGAAFVAFLFALHPLHVESVAWVAERKDLLSTLFFLLTIWVYLNFVDRPAIANYAGVIALFCCGLMSKPMVVTLPIVLLLLDWWPLGRFKAGRRVVTEKLPLLALALAAGAIALVSQQQAGAVAALTHVPVGTRVANAMVSYVMYLAAFLWPAHLSVIYPYPAEIAIWKWAGALLPLIAGTYAIFRSRRRYLIVGWLWFLSTLLPVIGLIQVGGQARADRYTYIPLIGIAIIVAWGATELFERLGWSKAALAGCAFAACGAWTAASWWNAQNWQNSRTLFEHAIESTQDNYVAHTNLGDALRAQGRTDEAIVQFESAFRIRPQDERVLDNLGAALQTAGRNSEAIPILLKAVQLHPDAYKAHVDLGHSLARSGQRDEATSQYRRALEIQPDGAEAHYGLGGVLMSQGRTDEARPHLQAGLAFLVERVRESPDDPDARYNLGTLYGFMGRNDDAIRELSEAIRLVPGDARARFNLGVALAARGREAEAADQFAEAVRLRPEDLGARQELERLRSAANQ